MSRFTDLICRVRDSTINPIPASWIGFSLDALYSSENRFYHNSDHIIAGLFELDSAREFLGAPDETELAWYFHDSVYHTDKKDNEEKSADLSDSLLLLAGVPFDRRVAVKKLILDTKHMSIPKSYDGRILCDIDLAILGKSESVYDSYRKAIRKEYSWVCNEDFAKGRLEVLNQFLSRKKIYFTETFSSKYEEQARKNLSRETRFLLAQ